MTITDPHLIDPARAETTVDRPPTSEALTPRRNRTLLAASAIAGVTAVLHLVGGGIDIARPLLASSLANEPRLVMYAVWHMATVALALSAIALCLAALPRHRAAAQHLVVFIGLMWIGFGLSFLAVGLSEQGGNLFTVLNQWILIVPAGILALVGARQDRPVRSTLDVS